ncbi:MAG: T9SS type A sorting domain-containing protein [Bacteroidetes bacterium]|nr:T9SS type A sorting domain-containing protein [Bacteroidota bacterium]
MKFIYSICLFIVLGFSAHAQITITAADMPVVGDTLRYSTVTDAAFVVANTGSGYTWDFSYPMPITQAVDTYKTATAVNFTYGLTISPTAYGYKVADSIPGLGSMLPVSVKSLYTFYNKKTSPSRYIAEGFAAMIAGLPTAVNYQDEDEIYFFPVTTSTNDSSTFRLNFSLATLGSMLQKGYRKTTVDGWGTIKTPYYTTPVNCIRVRSEIHEIDSVTLTAIPFPIGLPNNRVEYKWLVNGEHYPAFWVTCTLNGTTETPTSIRYRDSARATILSVPNTKAAITELNIYPNPATNNTVTIDVPASWMVYDVDVFDIQGKLVSQTKNTSVLNIQSMANGQYVVRVSNGQQLAYAVLNKQ